jgi:hypothetical protein
MSYDVGIWRAARLRQSIAGFLTRSNCFVRTWYHDGRPGGVPKGYRSAVSTAAQSTAALDHRAGR